MRIPAKSVEITLANGKVLHFIESEGDTVVVNEIETQPTGTSQNHPKSIHYYSLTLQHLVDVAKVQERGV